MSEDHAAATAASAERSASPDPAAPPKAGTGNPGRLVADSVEACLEIAATWHAWDGRPVARTVDGSASPDPATPPKPNTWTPAKALRRITDHLIDHLQQVEALLAGVPSIPDAWHGRFVTLDADWARFTEADYDEACSRLRRLGRWYVLRYQVAGPAAWDEPRGGEWTLREIAEHVAEVRFYAEQVGSLAVLAPE
jgi:hypothetical protein